MNKIPFLNLPPELGWGTRRKKILAFYKNQGKLKSERNNFVEIEDTWNSLEFRTWLNFSIFLIN